MRRWLSRLKPGTRFTLQPTAMVVGGLFLIAVIVRLGTVAVALGTSYNPYTRVAWGDMESYTALAVSLARGEGFSDHYKPVLQEFFRDPHHVRPTDPAQPTIYKAIGYPLFMAAIFRLIGYDLVTVLVIQAIISALSTLLVFAIGRQLGPPSVAFIAYTISVFYYPFWYKAILLLVETLLVFVTLVSLYGLLRWFRRPSWANGLGTGVALGAAFLIKPFVLPVVPCYLLAGYLYHRRRTGRRAFLISAAALVIGVSAVLAPWGIRNYVHSGRLLLTPSFGGYHLLLLYNEYNTRGISYNPPGFVNESYSGFQDKLMPGLHLTLPEHTPPLLAEYLQDHAHYRAAVEFLRTHPGHFFQMLPRTFWNVWRLDYVHATWYRKLSNIVCYAMLLPFVLLGVVAAVRRRNVPALLLAGFLLYFVLFNLVLTSQIRYRILVMPIWFLLGAWGLTVVWPRVRHASSSVAT